MNQVRIAPLVCAVLALLRVVSPAPGAAAARIDHEAECTYKRLTWEDFRGPVVNGQQVAWISATIVLEPVPVEVVVDERGATLARARNPIVYASMNKLQSGSQPGARTDRNLAHEQVHFDLTEYLARRLARELREVRAAATDSEAGPDAEALQRKVLLEIERLYATAMMELQRLQAQYDGETVHGTRAGAQKKWAARAATLLESEAPYELR